LSCLEKKKSWKLRNSGGELFKETCQDFHKVLRRKFCLNSKRNVLSFLGSIKKLSLKILKLLGMEWKTNNVHYHFSTDIFLDFSVICL
jgi:hypothetical protein